LFCAKVVQRERTKINMLTRFICLFFGYLVIWLFVDMVIWLIDDLLIC